MILAHRIPDLTDQMLAATLRAAEDPTHDARRWLLAAEVEHLERRLAVCYAELGLTPDRRAAYGSHLRHGAAKRRPRSHARRHSLRAGDARR